jgi:WD40 repeat protein
MSLTRLLVLFLGLALGLFAEAQDLPINNLRTVACSEGYTCKAFDNILIQLEKSLQNKKVEDAIFSLDNLEACDNCPNHRVFIEELRDHIANLGNLGVAGNKQDYSIVYFEDCDDNLLCLDFEKILSNVNSFLRKGDGANAYRELKALEACDKCPEHRDNLDDISDEIISLFREQNESLNELVVEQQATLNALQKRTDDLRRERKKVNQQLVINERMTRDALVTNYLRLANNYYNQGTEIGLEEARWLTDFVYNYVDSTHHEVRKMMHRLLNNQLLEYIDYDPDEGLYDYSYDEEQLAYSRIVTVDWSPDGQWLAVGMDNGRIVIFQESGEVVFDEDISEYDISDLNWNLESNILAFINGGTSVNFLKASPQGWTLTDRSLSLLNTASTVRWSPVVADELMVSTFDNVIYLYAKEEVSPRRTYSGGHDDWIRDLAWSPDATRFVSCDDQGYVVIWQVNTGEIAHRRRGHTDYVRTVDWHPEGHTIISGGDDNQLVFWDTTGQVVNRLTFDDWVYQARYTDSGEEIGLVTNSNTFYRITADERIPTTLPNGVDRFAWRGNYNTVEGNDHMVLAKEPPANYIVPEEQDLQMGRLAPGNSALEEGSITQTDWSPDGNFLAYVKGTKLEIVDEEKITSFDLSGIEIFSIAWHPGLSEALPNSNFLATVGSDNQLLIWDVSTMTIVQSEDLGETSRDLVWSPDGKLLAIVNDIGQLIVYDIELNKLFEIKITNDYLRAVDWSSNGRFLVVGSDDNSLVIYDWERKRVTERLSNHTDWIRDVLWLDDTHFASAGDDSKTIVWELSGREGKYQPLQILDRVKGFHLSLAYSGGTSGGFLAVGNTNNEVGFWRLNATMNAQFDTLLTMESQIHDLDWHPRSGSLALSTYSAIPQELDRYLNLQPAYDAELKEVIFKNLSEALNPEGGGLASYFYLPKVKVAPNRYDQLAWSDSERILAVVEEGGAHDLYNHLMVHDMKGRELLFEFAFSEEDIAHVLFSPNEKYLAIAPAQDRFTLFPLAASTDTINMEIEGEIMDWAWSANSRYLAILDREYDVNLYDVTTQTLKKYASSISDYDLGTVLFHPTNDQLLYILSHQGVYEVRTNRDTEARSIYQSTTFSLNETGVGAARGIWINGGDELLYVQKGAAPQLLEVTAGNAALKYTMGDPENYYAWTGGDANLLYEIHLMDDGEYFFNGNELEYARAWDIDTGKPISILRGVRKQVVREMKLSSDGHYLAAMGEDLIPSEGKYERGSSSVSIWDLRTQSEIFELSIGGIRQMAFSPKGNYLYTYFANGQVGIWPLFTPEINYYFANSGKDRYLEQLSSKDNQPFRNRIEEWELEKGVNFQEEANFELLKTREIARIRQNWGEYYVDQAWLSSDKQVATALFDKASSLHFRKGTSQIRPVSSDTLAMINIWIEQTYFRLGQKDDQAAEVALRKATRLQPQLKRLEMLHLLLDWQEGQREKVVGALLNGEVLALLEEYANWDRRDIHLQDEILFQRLTALMQSLPDPLSPASAPRFADEIQGFSAPVQEELLLMYYRVNTEHPALDTDGKRQAFYDEAVRFYGDRWEKTQQEESSLEDYILFNYYLQQLELRKDKTTKAAASVGRGRKGAEQLLVISPENIGYQETYLNILAEEALVKLKLNARNASDVKAELTAAKQRYATVESPYLTMELANAKLILGERKEAYLDYYSLLETYGYSGVENLILEEVGALARGEVAQTQAALQLYNTYRTDKQDFRESVVYFEETDLEGNTDFLNETYWSAYQSAKEWYESSMALNEVGMLPKDSLLSHSLEFNHTAGDYVYILLYTGSWEDAQQPVKDMQQYLSQYRWPTAVEAVLAVLKDDWSTTRNRLNQVAKLPNDGIRQDAYPTLREFLLNLPPGVQQHLNFQKRSEQWNNQLRN